MKFRSSSRIMILADLYEAANRLSPIKGLKRDVVLQRTRGVHREKTSN